MEKYVPDMYQENIFKINYELLLSKGIKCLLFDLDNTISPFTEREPNTEIINLFAELKEKFTIILFSNSPKKRVSRFAEILKIDYFYRAFKPSPNKFMEVFKKYKLNENEVAIIGDQLLTDVKGGNRVGIVSILIDPICNEDSIFTKINRLRETKLKKKLRKNNLFKGRFYDEKM